MTHQQLTPEIIHDLLVSPLPTIEICTRHQIAVADLRAMVESPQFRQLLDDLQAIEEIRAPTRRRRALEAIERIAELEPTSPNHTETIRKAAALILRTLKDPDKPQSQDSNPENPPPGHQESGNQSPKVERAIPKQSTNPTPAEDTAAFDAPSSPPSVASSLSRSVAPLPP